MMTEAQKRAKKKYLPKVKRMLIEFYPTESELIAHIEKQPKKQTYIKDLIRADIKKEGNQA
jgi:vacuolar-type H+-ATPase subunit E/Vma4